MQVRIIEGDLLDQKTEAIVNAWNRNIIPWWLLLPQGVAGAIKRRAGLEPFRELGRIGPIRSQWIETGGADNGSAAPGSRAQRGWASVSAGEPKPRKRGAPAQPTHCLSASAPLRYRGAPDASG